MQTLHTLPSDLSINPSDYRPTQVTENIPGNCIGMISRDAPGRWACFRNVPVAILKGVGAHVEEDMTVCTWVGCTMRRFSIPRKYVLVETELAVRDFTDSLGNKGGYSNFASIATALSQGKMEDMAAAQLQRILQQSHTNTVVEGMRNHASQQYNAKLSARARLPDGQTAVLYLPNEKHLQFTADVETTSSFWTEPRKMFKGLGDVRIGAELNAFPSASRNEPFVFMSLHAYDPEVEYVSTLHTKRMYKVMSAFAADHQNTVPDNKLGFYSRGWVPLESTNCNAKDANRVQESIFNWQTKERDVRADAITVVRSALYDILINPLGITIDPHNGMACIEDVLTALNRLPKINKLYPDGIRAVDLSLMGIRQTIISARIPWFVVAAIHIDKYNIAIQRDLDDTCCNMVSIRLPHVGTQQRILYPPSSLLPFYEIHSGRGEYVFVLLNSEEAARRIKNGNITSNTDLFSYRLPDVQDMAEIQSFKETPAEINCAMVASCRTLFSMSLAPDAYIGGHRVGGIRWIFDTKDNVEKVPRNLWLQILKYENGLWHPAWNKRKDIDIKINDTFTPPPDNTIISLKFQRRTRVVISEGTRLCACGAEISDVLNETCQHCGQLKITALGRHYQAEALIIKQDDWARQSMASLRSHAKTTMNQLQLVSRMVSKNKGPTSTMTLTNFPQGTELPSIEQAVLLMAMTHAVYNLAYYYQTMSRAEKIACAMV